MLRRALCVVLMASGGGVGALKVPLSTALLARVRRCDRGAAVAENARDFVVGGTTLGRVLPRAAEALASTAAFRVDDRTVRLVADGSPAARTAALAAAFADLRARDAAPCLRGWRDEPFALRPHFHAEPVAVVERAAAPLLGAPAFGVFCVGYVADDGGAPESVWVARRSPTKPTWPGSLDVFAAGGVAAGAAPLDAMRAELADEAGAAGPLLDALRPAGCVWYRPASRRARRGAISDLEREIFWRL